MRFNRRILDALKRSTLRLGNPEIGNDLGQRLWNIYVWQEIFSYAKKRVEAGWRDLLAAGYIPTDDELREKRGNIIVNESNALSCVVKVDDPRMMFDIEGFIDKLHELHGLDKQELILLAANCQKESKAVLTKRVVERVLDV